MIPPQNNWHWIPLGKDSIVCAYLEKRFRSRKALWTGHHMVIHRLIRFGAFFDTYSTKHCLIFNLHLFIKPQFWSSLPWRELLDELTRSSTAPTYIQARTFKSTDLMCPNSALTRCYSEDHSRLDPGSLDMESHVLPWGNCLLIVSMFQDSKHKMKVLPLARRTPRTVLVAKILRTPFIFKYIIKTPVYIIC